MAPSDCDDLLAVVHELFRILLIVFSIVWWVLIILLVLPSSSGDQSTSKRYQSWCLLYKLGAVQLYGGEYIEKLKIMEK